MCVVPPRPKLSDLAHGTQRLQPRRSCRVRCHVGLKRETTQCHAVNVRVTITIHIYENIHPQTQHDVAATAFRIRCSGTCETPVPLPHRSARRPAAEHQSEARGCLVLREISSTVQNKGHGNGMTRYTLPADGQSSLISQFGQSGLRAEQRRRPCHINQ